MLCEPLPPEPHPAKAPHNPESDLPPVLRAEWLTAIVFVYFGLRLLFFAVAVSPAVPPDEVTHFGISRIYAKVLLLPGNSADTFQYGLVTNIPYLYYWIMGRFLSLNVFPISDLLFLRLLNIPLAFATILFARRMLRLLTDDRLAHLLLLVAMTNTLMFSFLSASVSYDNLVNLLAAMAVYYLLSYFQTRSGARLGASILCQLAGCLTKSTFLPLALILGVLLLVHEIRRRRALRRAQAARVPTSIRLRPALMLGFPILIGLALNVHLYVGNTLHYGSLTPAMTDVLPLDEALQCRTVARDHAFSLFRDGHVSKEEALAVASQINHPGDRDGAIYLIENYDALKKSGTRPAGPLAYIPIWIHGMAASVFGIVGHLSMPNYGRALWPFYALMFLAGLAFVIRWRPRQSAWTATCFAVIAAFYGVFLMYAVNYRIYLSSGSPVLALQGRYIFPVLGPLYALSAFYLPGLFKGRRARLGVAAAVLLIFVASDFPYFLLNVTPQWLGR